MKDQEMTLVTAETLRDEILRHLKLSIGKDPSHASLYDWRMSLSLALRDRVVEPWFASTRKTYEGKHKRVYYLSMEFLIGRLIEDVTINLDVEDMAVEAMREGAYEFVQKPLDFKHLEVHVLLHLVNHGVAFPSPEVQFSPHFLPKPNLFLRRIKESVSLVHRDVWANSHQLR
jgi:hypothetical protein